MTDGLDVAGIRRRLRVINVDELLVELINRVLESHELIDTSTAAHYLGLRPGAAQPIAAYVNRAFVDLRLEPERAAEVSRRHAWKLIKPNTATGTLRVPSAALSARDAMSLAVDLFDEALERSSRSTVKSAMPVVVGKQAFVQSIRRLVAARHEYQTLGDGGSSPVVRVRVGDVTAALAAETTLDGAREFLRFIDDRGDDAGWNVVADADGRINRVTFGQGECAGWFFYVADAWPRAGRL